MVSVEEMNRHQCSLKGICYQIQLVLKAMIIINPASLFFTKEWGKEEGFKEEVRGNGLCRGSKGEGFKEEERKGK